MVLSQRENYQFLGIPIFKHVRLILGYLFISIAGHNWWMLLWFYDDLHIHSNC